MLTFACFLAVNDIYLFNYQTMAIRIVGVDLPQNKRGEIALTISMVLVEVVQQRYWIRLVLAVT